MGVPWGCHRQFPKVLTGRVVQAVLGALTAQMVQRDPVALVALVVLVALVALLTAEHTGTRVVLEKLEKA